MPDNRDGAKKLNNYRLKVGRFKSSAESTDTGLRPVGYESVLKLSSGFGSK
jgi:hypothetical protein